METSVELSVTRRRETASVSARSQLLTVLGEFVHPARRPVWTSTVLDAMAALGHEEKSARQSLNRTAAEGVLTSSRHGRRVLWTITPRGTDLLEEGTNRIYGFMRGGRPWDGRWLVLSIPVPESQRRLRHRLRTRLTWLGMGSPTPGLWISPETSRLEEVRAVVADLDLEDRSASWVGSTGGIGQESRVLGAAWDLDGVEEEYRTFLQRFESLRPASDLEAFVAQVEMVHEWRRFPFLDPALPAELLDHDWPGPRAGNVFHAKHASWNLAARAAWAELVAAAGPLPSVVEEGR